MRTQAARARASERFWLVATRLVTWPSVAAHPRRREVCRKAVDSTWWRLRWRGRLMKQPGPGSGSWSRSSPPSFRPGESRGEVLEVVSSAWRGRSLGATDRRWSGGWLPGGLRSGSLVRAEKTDALRVPASSGA